jgi:hypothetical protein
MPIRQHRSFPAIVALWFGALFGLGSLAIRPGLLESLVVSAQIDRLIPAAAAPLGDTARILIALGLTAFGALLGTVIGLRIARPRRDASEQEQVASPSEAPADQLSAGVESAADAQPQIPAPAEIEAEQPVLGRRRGLLALSEDESRDDYPESAALLAGTPQILNIAEIDFAAPAQVADAEADEPPQSDDLEALDMVSLAERLVNNLNNRRTQNEAVVSVPANEAIINAEREVAISAEAPHEVDPDELDIEDEETIDEDIGYSSLLNLSRVPERRQTFVRLQDEPAAAEFSEEPVVIFPGQAARAAAAAAAPTPTSIRRFGSLASPAQEQPSTDVQGNAALDSAETERALREALTSLQRMTGTA